MALGSACGFAASQTLPVAATLVRALGEAGVEGILAEALVAIMFVIGGIEASLLIWPLVSKTDAKRKRR